MRIVLAKSERLGQLSLFVNELDTVLLGEVACFHLVQHSETFDDRIAIRDQRFADMESWKMLALVESDLETALCQQGGSG